MAYDLDSDTTSEAFFVGMILLDIVLREFGKIALSDTGLVAALSAGLTALDLES
jgi:hypothetical protein